MHKLTIFFFTLITLESCQTFKKINDSKVQPIAPVPTDIVNTYLEQVPLDNLSFAVKLYTNDKDSLGLNYQFSTLLDKDIYSVITTTKDSIITVINKNYFGRSFADDGSNIWSYVVPPQLDVEMCDYCLRFTQNNIEILYKPNGQVFVNGVLKQTDIVQYFNVLYMLISLNNK